MVKMYVTGILRLRQITSGNILNATRGRVLSKYFSSKKSKKEDEETEEPIKYTTSPAYGYKAKVTRTGDPNPRLWYEPYVIMVSLTVFMIYFTVLREENDIDEELSRSLYSRISGLEEHQLRLSLNYNKEHGLDTTDIVKRLKELESMKKSEEDTDSVE